MAYPWLISAQINTFWDWEYSKHVNFQNFVPSFMKCAIGPLDTERVKTIYSKDPRLLVSVHPGGVPIKERLKCEEGSPCACGPTPLRASAVHSHRRWEDGGTPTVKRSGGLRGPANNHTHLVPLHNRPGCKIDSFGTLDKAAYPPNWRTNAHWRPNGYE